MRQTQYRHVFTYTYKDRIKGGGTGVIYTNTDQKSITASVMLGVTKIIKEEMGVDEVGITNVVFLNKVAVVEMGERE